MQKTKLCEFHLDGKCKYGSECAFAHQESELKTLPDLRKTRLCRAFSKGKCVDANCKFAHGQEELRGSEKKTSIRMRLKRRRASGRDGDAQSQERNVQGRYDTDGDGNRGRSPSRLCDRCFSTVATHLGISACPLCRGTRFIIDDNFGRG